MERALRTRRIAFEPSTSVTITYDRYGHLMPGNEDEASLSQPRRGVRVV
jgi:hypothetical protein